MIARVWSAHPVCPSQDAGWRRHHAVGVVRLQVPTRGMTVAVRRVMHDRAHRANSAAAGHASPQDAQPGRSTLSEPHVALGLGKGHKAEMVKFLQLGKSEHAAKREVVLHLSPADLPALEPGDHLFTPCEIEVTNQADVGQSGPGSNVEPKVAAMLLLTGNPHATDTGKDAKKIAGQQQTVTKNEHHAMFTFGDEASIQVPNTHAVQQDQPHVTLVMWAWDPHARSGGQDKVLVGANKHDYLQNHKPPEQDRARLNAVDEHGVTAGDRHEMHARAHGDEHIPVNGSEQIVYSLCLNPDGNPIEAGSQYYVESKIVADTNSRARLSAKMVVSGHHHATGGHIGGISPGQIGEHNGINVTAGSPDAIRKVGVFRVDKPLQGKVYVNVIVEAEVPGPGGANVTVKKADGYLRATRYDASLG
jgi:hypothetical protein